MATGLPSPVGPGKPLPVIPAKAGIQRAVVAAPGQERRKWIPAFAGMTEEGEDDGVGLDAEAGAAAAAGLGVGVGHLEAGAAEIVDEVDRAALDQIVGHRIDDERDSVAVGDEIVRL